MNNPNPFIPQGSLLEQKNRKRSRFQLAVFGVFAFNVLVIAPMLIQGCKRDTSADGGTTTQTTDNTTQTQPVQDTNPTTALSAQPTNPAVTQPPVAQPPVTQPPPTVQPPAATATEYVIVKGDTLDAIHKKFSVSVKAIEDANPGIVPTKLHEGQKIQVPAPTASAPSSTSATVAADGSEIYVVKAGDNLSNIAKTHHTTVKAIQTLNNLKTTRINVNEKLKMPMPSATPPTSTIPAAPAPSSAPAPAAPAPGTN